MKLNRAIEDLEDLGEEFKRNLEGLRIDIIENDMYEVVRRYKGEKESSIQKFVEMMDYSAKALIRDIEYYLDKLLNK